MGSFLYALVDRIHKAHGMTVVVVEHDLNYLLLHDSYGAYGNRKDQGSRSL